MFLTLANQITLVRLLLIIPFVICLLKTGDPEYGNLIRWVSILLFLLMAASDALDNGDYYNARELAIAAQQQA